MTEAVVDINVRKAGPDASILDIGGEVTSFAENALMDAYTKATTDGARTVILNFSGLEYMNSSGTGLLVTLLIRVNRQGQRLMAVGLNEHYTHIFELTRLNEAIPVFEDEGKALSSVSAKR